MNTVVKEKADASKCEILEGGNISVYSIWSKLEKYFDVEKFKDGDVECVFANGFEFTNKILIKLGELKLLKKAAWSVNSACQILIDDHEQIGQLVDKDNHL